MFVKKLELIEDNVNVGDLSISELEEVISNRKEDIKVSESKELVRELCRDLDKVTDAKKTKYYDGSYRLLVTVTCNKKGE